MGMFRFAIEIVSALVPSGKAFPPRHGLIINVVDERVWIDSDPQLLLDARLVFLDHLLKQPVRLLPLLLRQLHCFCRKYRKTERGSVSCTF